MRTTFGSFGGAWPRMTGRVRRMWSLYHAVAFRIPTVKAELGGCGKREIQANLYRCDHSVSLLLPV